MENFFTHHIISLGVGFGIGLIVGLFNAFTIGRLVERSNTEEMLHLQYEKLKQKVVAKLEMLSKHYNDSDVNVTLPDGINFKELVDLLVCLDETLFDKIIGLNHIYLDLISNGTSSAYFIQILSSLSN
jgi:hypothetical protein